jgi:hypothetical protein
LLALRESFFVDYAKNLVKAGRVILKSPCPDWLVVSKTRGGPKFREGRREACGIGICATGQKKSSFGRGTRVPFRRSRSLAGVLGNAVDGTFSSRPGLPAADSLDDISAISIS